MSEKILVVDDHAETRNLVSVILRRQGYDVYTAGSGPEGLIVAEEQLPHLILLDVMMPDMNGYDVCRQLRRHPQLNTVPIIMFTAKSHPNEKWEGFEAGANDYLVKPTNTEELGKRVRTILDNAKNGVRQSGMLTATTAEADDEETIVEGVSPVKPNGVLTVVVGSRGGVGTTTMAINVAFALAEQKPGVLLVDFDQVQGHISLYLNQKITVGLNDLVGVDPNYIRGELPDRIMVHNESLSFLLAKPNLHDQRPSLTAHHAASLAEAVQHVSPQTVVDVGCGVSIHNQPFIEQANYVIVCLQPERVSVSAAKQLIGRLKRLLAPTAQLYAVMLDFTQGVQLPRKAVESFIGHELHNVVLIQQQDMVQAVNSGRPLMIARPQTEAAATFRQIARQLVPAQ